MPDSAMPTSPPKWSGWASWRSLALVAVCAAFVGCLGQDSAIADQLPTTPDAAQPNPKVLRLSHESLGEISADGTRYLFARSNILSVYDTETKRERKVNGSADLASDGRHVVYGQCSSSTRCSAVRLEFASGRKMSVPGYSIHRGATMTSSSGRYVFACKTPCHDSRGGVLNAGILDMESRRFQRVFTQKPGHSLIAGALSPDGRTAVYAGLRDPGIYLFSARTGRTRRIANDGASGGAVRPLQVTNGGTQVIYRDRKSERPRLWFNNRRSPEIKGSFTDQGRVMTQDGKWLAMSCGSAIYLWATRTGEYRRVASATSTADSENFDTPERLLDPVTDGAISGLEISGDGSRIYFDDPEGSGYVATSAAVPMGTEPPTECEISE